MRGAALPAALLCAAFGLMLAFAPRPMRLPATILLAVTAVAAAFVWPARIHEAAFLGCWGAVIACCLAIHWRGGVPGPLAFGLAIAGGLFAGAVIAAEGRPADLLAALPWAALAVPAAFVVGRGWQVAIKVVSSWLIAVAVLAALLPSAAPTPGYVPDHMN